MAPTSLGGGSGGCDGSREESKARRRDPITTASDVGGLSIGDSDVTDHRLLAVSTSLERDAMRRLQLQCRY